MELIKENEKIILKYEDEVIETYSFDEAIDLSELIKFLFDKNLELKFDIKDNIGEKNSEEENLVSIILKVIGGYNAKVEEFNKYKLENQKSELKSDTTINDLYNDTLTSNEDKSDFALNNAELNELPDDFEIEGI